jgi:hypothetical protein
MASIARLAPSVDRIIAFIRPTTSKPCDGLKGDVSDQGRALSKVSMSGMFRAYFEKHNIQGTRQAWVAY